MPHVSSGGGDDLASSDEIKVFKDEGEEEKRSSENLTDLKSSLVTEGEEVSVDQAAPAQPQARSLSEDLATVFWIRPELTGVFSAPFLHDKNHTPVPGQSYSTGKSGVHVPRPEPGSLHLGKSSFEPIPGPIGYVVSPYHHPNGTLGASVSMANKMPMVPPTHPGSPLPFMVYNGEHFSQPPPAHMGIPPVHIDPKTDGFFFAGIPRPAVYPLTTPGQYPHPMFSHDFAQQLQWHPSSMYPMTSAGFRGGYPTTLQVTSSSLPRFGPPLLPPHPGMLPHPGLHPALVTSHQGPKHDLTSPIPDNRHSLQVYSVDQKPVIPKVSESGCSSSNSSVPNSSQQHLHHPQHNRSQSASDKKNKLNHVKRPLNAFMLYMREMRAKVVAECTLKESAAINQILGRRWHSLTREEQAKYYEMARKERQLHMQLYPGWTARDNYAQNQKKKKRKKDKTQDGGECFNEASNPKKCRARFGLDQQSSWCKPCRRKKKCIRYVDGMDNANESEDNIGSIEAPTPDSKSPEDCSDSDNLNVSPDLSLSSPQVPSEPERMCTENHTSVTCMKHHPLSIQHLTGQPLCKTECCDTTPVNIPQLPTPPSTDSSTTTAPPMLTVT